MRGDFYLHLSVELDLVFHSMSYDLVNLCNFKIEVSSENPKHFPTFALL